MPAALKDPMDRTLPSPQGSARLRRLLRDRRPAVFLDYDGTLTPIVERPELAVLSEQMREVIRELAARVAVSIVSGRDRADVERLVGLPEVAYVGGHGLDIAGPYGVTLEASIPAWIAPRMAEVALHLKSRLGSISGVEIEAKRYSAVAHVRRADEAGVEVVHRVISDLVESDARLRRSSGKKIVEILPAVEWDKGRAVLALLEFFSTSAVAPFPIVLGDDVTDEDAFAAIADRGVGILVAESPRPSSATYRLRDPDEVRQFLTWLTNLIG
jgi:alpha,alpha-trehalase